MKRRLRAIFSRLQNVLLASFTFIAVLTFVVATLTASVVVSRYVEQAEDARVDRDMALAVAFYERSLAQLNGAAVRLAAEPAVSAGIRAFQQADDLAVAGDLARRLNAELTTMYPTGTRFALVVDGNGALVTARGTIGGELGPLPADGNWSEFPLLATALTHRQPEIATEIIDQPLLAQIGLSKQAYIPLKETEKANPEPFDTREGTAGLAQVACAPVLAEDGTAIGAVIFFHLFNNDFTLVDEVRAVAAVDTATIFFGDLRVSTNVLEGGERAIGTRVSQAVFDTVLKQEEPFTGPAYVVNEWFITRYLPLYDHLDQVTGMLYVGARRATFIDLQHRLRNRIVLVALVAIVPVALLALPIARLITHPLEEMARVSHQVAQGDTQVRVPEGGIGEVAVLGQSLNAMIVDLDAMITDLDATHDQLIQTEKLASMGQLAAGVAHQLNNPLGTILLFSDIVLEDLPEDSQTRSDIQMITQEAHRAKEIVTALLNFARQQKAWAHPTSLVAMLHEILERSRQQPDFHNIELVEEIASDLPAIEADPGQLENVFVNLMDNAADAMPEGGTLIVRAFPSPDDKSVVVEVEDTGCGISPEHLSKIFSPFFTTKQPGEGTGLGLAIAYGIVKVHRGAIRCRSQVGQGTVFTVTLPIRLPNTSAQASTSVEPLVQEPM